MNKPLILHIETATSICSVALSEGEKIIAMRESDRNRSHAILLSRFIRECLKESGREITMLDAINVGKGPGSYTGLRIGVSTVKGIAYAGRIPVIATGTLHTLTRAAMNSTVVQIIPEENNKDLLLCPMIDARRMEVYTALFKPDGQIYREITAEIITEHSFPDLFANHTICFFGDGSEKCKSVIHHPNACFIDRIIPSATFMVPLALDAFFKKRFENTAYFEPFYLKEFLATIPKKKIL
ncbi:MAG TPA: tRNA (adenosine(37)-N6)-threonylcarbamoyltransferase complex dimerization subunit type 1 TsaB [Bacteroidaceae bacterium]|nr:tRNA (adenosine(37)-N6)-threonylcarbamoyltransferase complex dimerization subunit type 1 TsaB [Bacteroidaceae bacterium]